MKIKATLFFLLISIFLLDAQTEMLYSRARINMAGTEIDELAKLGIDVTHGIFAVDRFYINDFSDYELEQVEAAGFSYEIEIADVQAYYLSQNDVVEERNSPECEEDDIGLPDYAVPENFNLGYGRVLFLSGNAREPGRYGGSISRPDYSENAH